ncbi:hypothetical protein E4T42_06124 [Aureobasidium subglaciale]|nr:hypothetical protein E4T42_06124 [Aureobasidium subglaciale]
MGEQLDDDRWIDELFYSEPLPDAMGSEKRREVLQNLGLWDKYEALRRKYQQNSLRGFKRPPREPEIRLNDYPCIHFEVLCPYTRDLFVDGELDYKPEFKRPEGIYTMRALLWLFRELQCYKPENRRLLVISPTWKDALNHYATIDPTTKTAIPPGLGIKERYMQIIEEGLAVWSAYLIELDRLHSIVQTVREQRQAAIDRRAAGEETDEEGPRPLTPVDATYALQAADVPPFDHEPRIAQLGIAAARKVVSESNMICHLARNLFANMRHQIFDNDDQDQMAYVQFWQRVALDLMIPMSCFYWNMIDLVIPGERTLVDPRDPVNRDDDWPDCDVANPSIQEWITEWRTPMGPPLYGPGEVEGSAIPNAREKTAYLNLKQRQDPKLHEELGEFALIHFEILIMWDFNASATPGQVTVPRVSKANIRFYIDMVTAMPEGYETRFMTYIVMKDVRQGRYSHNPKSKRQFEIGSRLGQKWVRILQKAIQEWKGYLAYITAGIQTKKMRILTRRKLEPRHKTESLPQPRGE